MAGRSRWLPRVALGAGLLGVTLAAAPARGEPVDDPDGLLKGMVIMSPGPMSDWTYQPAFRGNTRDKWRAYASLTEMKDGARSATLHLIVRGLAREVLSSIDFEVDDDETKITLPSPDAKLRQVSACRQLIEIEVNGQEDLIRSLADADAATVSYPGDPEKRRFRLHDFELDEMDRIAGLLDVKRLPRPKATPASGADADGVGQAGHGGATNPVIIPASKVQPVYPKQARLRRQQARVVLQALILKDGTVDKLEPLESTGDCGFEEAAIAAVKQWRYKPATQGGKPVSVYFTVVVEFALETHSSGR